LKIKIKKTAKSFAIEINKGESLLILNIPSINMKSFIDGNTELHDKYFTEAQIYAVLLFNNNFPEYLCTK